MARGVKLDLNFGSDWGEGWSEVEEANIVTENELLLPSKHQLIFKKERRRGKPVTLVGPLHVSVNDAKTLLQTIKKQVGCGGTCKAEWMEFQGDIAPRLRDCFEAQGYRFKR